MSLGETLISTKNQRRRVVDRINETKRYVKAFTWIVISSLEETKDGSLGSSPVWIYMNSLLFV